MKRDKYGSPKILSYLSMLLFIGMVAAFMMFLFSYYSRVVNKSREEMARNFVRIFIPTALDYYLVDMGEYPERLESLWEPPAARGAWNGPYIMPFPLKDPWNRDYHYAYPGIRNTGSYDIWSDGMNPQKDSDDIRNWNINE